MAQRKCLFLYGVDTRTICVFYTSKQCHETVGVLETGCVYTVYTESKAEQQQQRVLRLCVYTGGIQVVLSIGHLRF